jgi:predicted ABC-type exoprotein transport system permease subunit
LLGIFGAFLPLLLAHYYYCMLALIPLIFPNDRRIWSLLGLFMILITLTSSLRPVAKVPDLAYLLYSLEVLALLLSVLVLKIWSPRPRSAGWRA